MSLSICEMTNNLEYWIDVVRTDTALLKNNKIN